MMDFPGTYLREKRNILENTRKIKKSVLEDFCGFSLAWAGRQKVNAIIIIYLHVGNRSVGILLVTLRL